MTHRWIQGELFPSATAGSARELETFLNQCAMQPVRVVVTDNRVTMITVRSLPSRTLVVRLHRAFLSAPIEVWKALQTYLATGRRAAWKTVCAFACSIETDHPPPRQRTVRTHGAVHNLTAIRDDVNERFFNARLTCRVGWGTRRARSLAASRTRSIRFGSYHRAENLVLIHPRLDAPDVPREFVTYIVFHEMLHAAIPSARRNGRWVHHSPEFRHLESRFPDWAGMAQWSRKILDDKRGGTPSSVRRARLRE